MRLDRDFFEKAFSANLKNIVCEGSFSEAVLCTDSREIQSDSFFWPLAGDKFDGHDFIPEALDRGVRGFVFSRPLSQEMLKKASAQGCWVVEVKDALKALHEWANWHRRGLKAKVVAITGSNGKTTCKNLLASILGQKYKTVYSKKSFNNHVGVPMTLLEMDEKTEYAVIEMGMNHKGEISMLMKIVEPDMGILTNVTTAHLGHFRDFGELVQSKGEMALEMRPGAPLIRNVSLSSYPPFNGKLACSVLTFGPEGSGADRVYAAPENTAEGLKVRVSGKGEILDLEYPGLGLHNAENIAAVVSAALELGISQDIIRTGLENFPQQSMRMERLWLKDVLIINDAYNANPASMESAIRTLNDMKISGRKWMVAGNMNELGDFASEFHIKTAKQIAGTSFKGVFTYGINAREITDYLNRNTSIESRHFEDKKKMAEYLFARLEPGDVLLLKGSRGNALETVQYDLFEKAGLSHV